MLTVSMTSRLLFILCGQMTVVVKNVHQNPLVWPDVSILRIFVPFEPCLSLNTLTSSKRKFQLSRIGF